MKITLSINKNIGTNIISSLTFIYLIGLYLFSEKIVLLSILYLVLLCFYGLIMSRNIKIAISKFSLCWITYLILGSITTVIVGISNVSDLLDLLASILIALTFVVIRINNEYIRLRFKALRTTCIIVLIGCFMQILMPNLLIRLNSMRMGETKYRWFMDFFRSGFIVGFSFQTAVTGFYLSLLILFVFCLWVDKKNCYSKWIKLCLCIVMLISYGFLFFTGKRIFIGLVVIIQLVIYAIYSKKHIFKVLALAIGLLTIVYTLFEYTSMGDKLISRITSLDPTRGRSYIYGILIKSFLERPILGNGLASTLKIVTGYSNGHNIYLQILSESGIVGFLIIVPMMIKYAVKNVHLLIEAISNNRNMFLYSLCLSIQLLFIGWGMTGNPLYDVYPFIVYCIAIGSIDTIADEEEM